MTVTGIDLGNLQSVIAVARNRGIDIICNEVSNRTTPTMVGFGPKSRFIGEAAKTQEISNLRNTIGNLKRLIGKRIDDPELELEKGFLGSMVEFGGSNGELVVKVQYEGREQEFTMVQLLTAYFTKIKEITRKETGAGPSYSVLSVPGYFGDGQRRAVLDAAAAAGINCLRLVNDLTAAAIQYGITKLDLPEDKPRHVCIVDMGHSGYSVSIVAFTKNKLQVKGVGYDKHLGGRNFDQVICDALVEQFRKSHKLDLASNAKAMFRLRAAAEKAKKVLSANSAASLSVEAIMDDRDVSCIIQRSDFESWAEPLLARLQAPLQQALTMSGLSKENIDAVEIVGGSTRIPAVKAALANFFTGVATTGDSIISTTLNQDEAIARGCAYQCAIISPVFRVRDYGIEDIVYYPIACSWEAPPENPKDVGGVLFPQGSKAPSLKLLTFKRDKPFDINVSYHQSHQSIARFTVKAPPGETPNVIKIKTRMDPSGLINFESAIMEQTVIVEQEEVVAVPEPTKKQPEDADVKMTSSDDEKKTGEDVKMSDESAATKEAEPKKSKKSVKKIKETEVTILAGFSNALSKEGLAALKAKEASYEAADALIAQTEEARNSVEEYIYEFREKISEGGLLHAYISDQDKVTFGQLMTESEDWLYSEQGEDADIKAYLEKLQTLKAYGEPGAERHREQEMREVEQRSLRASIFSLCELAKSQDEKYSHISPEDRQLALAECDKVTQWLDMELERQSKLALFKDPIIKSIEITNKNKTLNDFVVKIMNKPKPEPKKAPVVDPASKTSASEVPPAAEQQDQQQETTSPLQQEQQQGEEVSVKMEE